MPYEELIPLNELQPQQVGYLWRIATDDPGILRYLGQRKLIPGQKITVLEIAPFKGPITIQVGDSGDASDAADDARQVFGVELATLLHLMLDKTPKDIRSGWRL
ncbi:MAG: FeoA family protein [Chloroflexi bacterium]|nr:FeoA family protein [Chloroflexota bacterium]